MRNTIAVFKNQFNEFMADKEQLILFILFPALAFFQTRIVDLDYGMSPSQIVKGMASLFASVVMIMILPPIIAEHRENGSLRFMVMSGIKPFSYLLGIGSFFMVINMLVAGFFVWLGEFRGSALINFMLTMFLAVSCSILIGSIIGIVSKNRQKAVSFSIPIGMGLVMLPMFGEVLESIQPLLNILYLERINNMMLEVQTGAFMTDLFVVLVNIAMLVLIFAGIFKSKGLKS